MGNSTVSVSDNKKMNIGLVIMASGLSKRFGRNKLMELLDDKPLIKWILDLTNNLFEKRIVVTRSEEVKSLCDSYGIDCIVHELPNRNDTIRIGLNAIMEDVDYCFFTPGDQPLISKESVIQLIETARNNKDKIVRTGYSDDVGSPVGFPKALFSDLLNLPTGKGGSFVINKSKTPVCIVNVKNEYELQDVDTLDDLEKVKSILERV